MSLIDAFTNSIAQVPAGLDPTKREFLFAIRLDGNKGSGTEEDPYNGSNVADLDTILLSLPANSIIRFGPGVFQTRGFSVDALNPGWRVQSGQIIRGAGIAQTTLQLVDYVPGSTDPSTYYAAVLGTEVSVLDIEIFDITLDANLARQPKTSGKPIRAQCIFFQGVGRIRVHKVRCINWGTHSTGLEGFPIYIQGIDSSYCENVVEDCIIEQPDLSPAREITLLNNHAWQDNPNVFCTLRNNYINGDFTTGTPPPPLNVASINYDTGTGIITVKTTWPHRFLVNDNVVIAGASIPLYNGRWVVATSDAFCTFTIVQTGLGSAVPTNAGITVQLNIPRAMLVSGFSRSGSVVTVTTPFAHGRLVGDWIRIAGVKVSGGVSIFNNAYNGSFKILSTPTLSTFTYQTDQAPTADPDTILGIWLDRWPCQNVMISLAVDGGGTVAGIQWLWENVVGPPPPNNILIQVTTVAPHYRIPGESVIILNVDKPGWSGYFPVIEWAPDHNSRFFTVRAATSVSTGLPSLAITDLQSSSIGENLQALTAITGYGPVVRGNRVIGTTKGGPYHDFGTTPVHDIIVWDNYYFFVATGQHSALNLNFGSGGDAEDRTLAERNIIDLQPNPVGTWNQSQPSAFSFGATLASPGHYGFASLVIRDNLIRIADGGLSPSSVYLVHQEAGVDVHGAKYLIIQRNLIDLPGSTFAIHVRDYANAAFFNNNTTSGGDLVAMFDSVSLSTFLDERAHFLDEPAMQANRHILTGWYST